MFIRDAPKEIDNSHKDSCSKVTTEIFTVTVKMKMKLKLTLHKYKQQLHHYLPHCQLSWWHLYHLEHNYLLNIHTYIQNNNKHATHGTEHRNVAWGSEYSKVGREEKEQERDGREGCAVLSPTTAHWDAEMRQNIDIIQDTRNT